MYWVWQIVLLKGPVCQKDKKTKNQTVFSQLPFNGFNGFISTGFEISFATQLQFISVFVLLTQFENAILKKESTKIYVSFFKQCPRYFR